MNALLAMQTSGRNLYHCDPWMGEPERSHYEELEAHEGLTYFRGELFQITSRPGKDPDRFSQGRPPSATVYRIEFPRPGKRYLMHKGLSIVVDFDLYWETYAEIIGVWGILPLDRLNELSEQLQEEVNSGDWDDKPSGVYRLRCTFQTEETDEVGRVCVPSYWDTEVIDVQPHVEEDGE